MQDNTNTSYPTDWHQRILRDLCEIQIGGTPSRNVPRFWAEAGDGYPWVAIADLGPKWVYQTAEHITAAGVANSNVKLIPKGTVLMSFKLTLGRVGIAGTDLYTNEAIAAFFPSVADLYERWLYHALPGIAKGGTAEQAIKGQTLNKDKLQRLLLRLPPLPEQRRIAEMLDTVDAAIQQTEALIAKLTLMKAGLLHDLLTRGLDAQGQLRDPIAHPEQFKDSPLGRIPREWEIKPLEECVRSEAPITYGIVQAGPHIEGGVPYIRTGDMAGDHLILDGLLRTSPRIAASYRRSEVRAGEIVCAIRATVGKVLEVPPELDGANLTQGTARIAPRAEINSHFLLWSLRSNYVVREFDLAIKGTTFSEITLGELRKIKVAIPQRLNEQDAVAAILDAQDARLRAEEAYCDKLKQLKQGLMRDLLTGRVRVQAAEAAQ